MFRFNHRNKILTFESVIKRLYNKNPDHSCKPNQLLHLKHTEYQQSSFFPAFLGLSTISLVAAGLTYHYNEDVRENLQPYLSKKTKLLLDDYLGPNNIDRLRKKLDDLLGFNIWPLSTKEKNGSFSNEINSKPIGMEIKEVVKTPLAVIESVKTDPVQREADRIKKLNDDFTEKLTTQMAQTEAQLTTTVLQLMEFSDKIEQHSQKLKRAIEDDGTTTPNPWEEVTSSQSLQQNVKLKSEAEVKKLEFSLEKLQKIIDESQKVVELKSHEKVPEAVKALADMRYRLQQKQAVVDKAMFSAQITNQYKELIQQGRDRFKQEMASLGPNVSNWSRKRSDKLTTDDLNAMIIHAHRRIHQLQARIAELEAMEVLKIQSALNEKEKQDEVVTAETVKRELARERAILSIEKQEALAQLAQQHELDLKWALTRQATAHGEHVQQLLRIQKDEVEKQHNLAVREALLQERDKMRSAVEAWRMRVEGIEAAVEGRADMELLSREAQDLWVACHALDGALNGSGVTPPLARYLASFREAAQPSSLPTLQLFLDSVPAGACQNGVCTQQLLTRRFDQVKTVCRRVSMIDETGAPLAMFIVSWLRSLLILTPARLIEPDTEVDPENHDYDTHQIIASAEKAVCCQDFDLAVRLLNLLSGMPRAVAHDWIADARVFLETKLAADALSSYTSSKTAGSIPPMNSIGEVHSQV